MITRTQCPVCSASLGAPLFSAAYQDPALQGYLQRIRYNMPAEWFAGREYAIQDCMDCGLLFQRDVLDDVQASRLYGQNEAGLRLEEDDSVLALAHLAADALLARRLVATRRPRVLDFGMGWGRFALLAQGFGCEVDGVEMSETTREHARRHGIRVLEEKDLPEAQYDFILADQVMEHLVEPVLLARRLASRLKPGGLLLLGVPGHRRLRGVLRAAKGVASLTDRDIDVLSPTIHLNLFDTRSLVRLGVEAGLELFRPPFPAALGAGQLWDRPRQWNRNIRLAWKYSRGTGNRLWFRRAASARRS